MIHTNHPAKVVRTSCHALTHYMVLCRLHTHYKHFSRVSSACFIIATNKTDTQHDVRCLIFVLSEAGFHS